MSRNASSGSARKLQISSPQPYQPPPRSFDAPLPPALQPVHVPPGLVARRPSANDVSSPSVARGSTNGAGNGNNIGGGGARFEAAIPPPGVAVDGRTGDLSDARRVLSGPGPGTASAPLRPTRSIRRAKGTDTSNVTTSRGNVHHDHPDQTLRIPPADQRPSNRNPSPPSHSLAVPASFVQPQIPQYPQRPTAPHQPSSHSQFAEEQALSPVEPPTPIGTQPPNSGKLWEQERVQRSQLLEMQKGQLGRNKERENKLLGVVNAFSSNAKGTSRAGDTSKSPNTGEESREGSGTATPRDANMYTSEQDLLIGRGGRDFDDVDAQDPKSSSTDDRLQSFLQAHHTLSQSLSKTVRSHYQVYANSLPVHADLIAALNRIQAVVRETKQGLKQGKELLAGGAAGMDARSPRHTGTQAGGAGKRGEMAALWNKERTLRDSLKLLDT
ncbi:hypothetical protein QFC19_008564, partial [Naganishia cerealis]